VGETETVDGTPIWRILYAQNTTTKFQFTTYERDSESGNDYAMARYDINRLGRFASPDPLSRTIAGCPTLSPEFGEGWELITDSSNYGTGKDTSSLVPTRHRV
jgi:RHS repeat-associated protein